MASYYPWPRPRGDVVIFICFLTNFFFKRYFHILLYGVWIDSTVMQDTVGLQTNKSFPIQTCTQKAQLTLFKHVYSTRVHIQTITLVKQAHYVRAVWFPNFQHH